MEEQKLLIIDGNSLLNRAYYAIPPLNSHDGKNVNAVFGFINILFKALTDMQPTHLVITFDKKGKNFRHQLYADYKGTRKGMPDDLAQQMPTLFDLLDKMKIKTVGKSGVEADDVIGTLAKRFSLPTVIVSGDRDLLQLIDKNTRVLLTKRGITDVECVTENNMHDLFGMTASQVVEYKALRGDSADNIPGVAGIGEKTAKSLLDKYGTIEEIYDNIAEINGNVQTKLLAGKDMAFLCKKLATIMTDVDLDCTVDDAKFLPIPSSVKDDFEKLEFRSLLKKLSELCDDKEAVAVNEEIFENVLINDAISLQRLATDLKDSKNLSFYISQNIYIAADAGKQSEA